MRVENLPVDVAVRSCCLSAASSCQYSRDLLSFLHAQVTQIHFRDCVTSAGSRRRSRRQLYFRFTGGRGMRGFGAGWRRWRGVVGAGEGERPRRGDDDRRRRLESRREQSRQTAEQAHRADHRAQRASKIWRALSYRAHRRPDQSISASRNQNNACLVDVCCAPARTPVGLFTAQERGRKELDDAERCPRINMHDPITGENGMVWVRGWPLVYQQQQTGSDQYRSAAGGHRLCQPMRVGSVDCSWSSPPLTLHLSLQSPVVKQSPSDVIRQLL